MEIDVAKKVPETVAIVAMGESRSQYIGDCMRAGGRFGVADETWVINKMGHVIYHDVMFRMDDLRVPRSVNQRIVKDKDMISVHERQTEWMKTHNKPIITSTVYPEFPTSVAYPLENVINDLGTHYLLNTPVYAAAYAIHIGVKKMKMYGCDYTYKESPHFAEQGRGNMEFILSIALQRVIEVEIARKSTLLGMNLDINEHLYGYEHIIEIVKDEEKEDRVKLVHRHDLTKERKDEQEARERQILETFKLKYETDAPHEPRQIVLEGACDDTHQGEEQCQHQNDSQMALQT